MKCKRAKENISLFIDGRLDPRDQAQLNEHLERCPDCSTYLEDLRAGLAMLREEGLERPSENFEWNLRRKLQRALARRQESRLPETGGGRDFWRFGLSAAAALVLVLAGGWIWYQSQFGIPVPDEPAPRNLAGAGEARQGWPGWVDPGPGDLMPVTDRIGGPAGIPAAGYRAEPGPPRSASPADSVVGRDMD